MVGAHGKVAIVVGGATGVGPRICHALAKGGTRIAIIDVDGASATALATQLDPDGAHVIAIPLDHTCCDELAKGVREAVEWFGALDILVDNVQSVRLGGARVLVADACRPYLLAGGHVINVAPDLEAAAIPDSVTREWEWYGISINTVAAVTLDNGSSKAADDRLDDLDRLLIGMSIPPHPGVLVA